MTTKHETFGARFKRLRLKAGLTHMQIARRMNLSQPRVSQMEREDNISLNKANKLAKVLGVTPAELMGLA